MKTRVDAIIELTKAGWTAAEIKQALGDDGYQAEPVTVPPIQPVPYVPVYPSVPGWYSDRPPREWWQYPVITYSDSNVTAVTYRVIGDEQQ